MLLWRYKLGGASKVVYVSVQIFCFYYFYFDILFFWYGFSGGRLNYWSPDHNSDLGTGRDFGDIANAVCGAGTETHTIASQKQDVVMRRLRSDRGNASITHKSNIV